MFVVLPDGSQKEVQANATGSVTLFDVAQSIGAGLAKSALAGKINGVTKDLTATVPEQAAVEIITSKSPEGLEIIRHSTAHVLAMAVQKLWPKTQVTIGPVIENGFYYDFSFPEGVKISDADFPKIEKEMQEIVKANIPAVRKEWPRPDVIDTFSKLGEVFKVEIIRGLPEGSVISTYHMGDWFDLCVGPHVPSTSKLGAFKLTALAGAYWRGDEKNPALTRIYGTAWADNKALEDYLKRLEEAKKRDHRVLGKQLNLFSFQKEAPANPFFHAKGQTLFNQLIKYMKRKNLEFGFEEVGTPLVMSVDLWHKSGHYDNFRENMYFTQVDETQSAIKPMNCPGHCLIYAQDRRSYRELPIRFSEFGRVHRHERSGVTHGLMRVRSFIQDDAHVFCRVDQIADEVFKMMDLIDKTYRGMGFSDYKVAMATRPEKSIGTDEMWKAAEDTLEGVLKSKNITYSVEKGGGAFYGPKMEYHLIDSVGRSWQCGTIQLDFSMPSRFGLEFIGSDDKPHTPVMIHRAVLGSLERFMGIFIEHFAGHFPLWASPVQARVISVGETQADYAEKVFKQLRSAGVRVELDVSKEKLGYKVREAQLQKVPYMLVIGDKEVEAGAVSPRKVDGTNLPALPVDAFVQLVKDECKENWSL